MRVSQKEVGKRSSLVTFSHASVTFLEKEFVGHFFSRFCHFFRHFFCQTPFAGLLLRQGDENREFHGESADVGGGGRIGILIKPAPFF